MGYTIVMVNELSQEIELSALSRSNRGVVFKSQIAGSESSGIGLV